jgi:iron complex outermembrane receptor protein
MNIRPFRTRAALLCLLATAPLPGLAQNAATLPETVVTATRFPDDAATLPFGVSIMTSDDIKRSGVSTINEALMKLLGVPGRQDSYGGGDYSLDLRGFGTTSDSNQVVVVDGVKLNEADQSTTRLAGIPIDMVERIEVIRGSGAVLYGEGATGGVIAITTKAGRGVERRNTAQIYGAMGSYGLQESRASATIASGGFSIDMSANKRLADNQRDNFKSDVGGDSVTAQWSNDRLRLGARYARDELRSGLPGSLTSAQYDANPRQASTPNDYANIKNYRQAVFAEAMLGEWEVGLDAGNRSKNLFSSYSGFPYGYDVKSDDLTLRARNSRKIGDVTNVLIFGTDKNDWVRTDNSSTTSRSASQGYYVKDDVILASGTRLSGGWRADDIQRGIDATTSRVSEKPQAWEFGLLKPVAPDVSVYGRVGQSYRVANVDEFGFVSPGVILRPQISRDTELGTRMRRGALQFDARIYRSELTDEIGFDANAPGPWGSGANVNLDPTRRQGLELEGRYAVRPNVNVRLNAALRDARFVSGSYAGNNVPLVPGKTLALRADWAPAPGHRIDTGLNLVSAQNPDMGNLCSMPGYATLDARYSYQYRNAEFSMGVNNLTDRKYYTQAFTCSAGVTAGIYPEAGQWVTASARLHF